jgi:DUF1680 family protein
VARTLASLAGYVATSSAHGIQIHQYANSSIHTVLEGGTPVELTVTTGYPATGGIRIESTAASTAEWTLTLRVPAWADGARLSVNGDQRDAQPGAVEVTRTFAPGDVVELELPVAPRWTWPHPRVDAVRGSVAVERGPLVMCLESVDLAAAGAGAVSVEDVRVDTSQAPADADGVTSVMVARVEPDRDGALSSWPYSEHPDAAAGIAAEAVRLIPYHQWANRGSSTMRVWLPVRA